MTTPWQEQQDFVRNVKGAGASVLLIMLMSGRSLTNRELQMATGYSDKPVTDALAWLEPRGIVHYISPSDGWALGSGITRLPFSPLQLESIGNLLKSGSDTRLLPQVALAEATCSLGTQAAPSPVDNFFMADGEDRNISDLGGEDRNISDPSCLVVVVDQEILRDPNNNNNNNGHPVRKISELLRKIGIVGAGLRKVLRQPPASADVVAWHWWTQTQAWLENPAGYICKRLLENEPPPPGFAELAAVWPQLDEDDRAELHIEATGTDCGRYLHPAAQNGHQLRQWLPDDFWPQLDAAALTAYLELSQKAATVLETAS